MSYLQQFGVSRISPLNLTEREKPSKEEVLNMMTVGVDQDPNIDPATKIIEKNNNESEAGVGGGFGKFFTKEAIKHGLKKYVGPLAGKAFGIGAMMLTPTAGYAQTRDHEIDSKLSEKLEQEWQYKAEKDRRDQKAKKRGIKTIMDPNY